MENGGRVGREWSAAQAAHRIKRRRVRQPYADRRGLSSDGLQGGGEVVQGVGEGRVLRPGDGTSFKYLRGTPV